MPNNASQWVVAALLSLGLHTPDAMAQQGSVVAERLHANAVDSFRQGRFSEAYGRMMSLADAGYPPSAQVALWMYANGPTLFGKDWDSNQEQLTAWAQVAGQPAPTMVARVYPQAQVRAAMQARRGMP